MNKICRLAAVLLLAGLPATTLYAQTVEDGSQMPEEWEPMEEPGAVPETQIPADQFEQPATQGTQETVVPDAATGATEQETVVPAGPSAPEAPQAPADDPNEAPGEPLLEEQQETQVPQEQPEAQGEFPPADQGAPVLVIPVKPEEGSGEEGSGETQLLIIPLEPEEGQPSPEQEPQFPPEGQPAPESETPADPEQVYIQ